MKGIHYFSKNISIENKEILNLIGFRARLSLDLAQLKLPIVPGFILDQELVAKLGRLQINSELKNLCLKLEKDFNKTYDGQENPMILKLVISPTLQIFTYPSLHGVGITDRNIHAFAKAVGENFAFSEYKSYLIKGALNLIVKTEKKQDKQKEIETFIKKLKKETDLPTTKKLIEEAKSYLPAKFFTDAFFQLEFLLKQLSLMLNQDEMDNDDTSILVQPLVYGNYSKGSAFGRYFTRNIISGENKIQGFLYREKFDSTEKESEEDISQIQSEYYNELIKISEKIESHFKEIREVLFTVENDKLWLIEQRNVVRKSTQAELKALLYLKSKKIIDDNYIVKRMKPEQISDILHPVLNPKSIKNLPNITGGICGATGSAVGRVYFSTDKLIEEYRKALLQNEDTNCILCMPATFAEDVKAIEIATGVLSTEGGYAAHASVVARQYGKVSLVNTDLRIQKTQFSINGTTVKEGDYISLDVPYDGDPDIFIGKAELITPEPEESGLFELVEILNKKVKTFRVLANVDKPRDAELAKQFGAEGIGLCRTEHMFFEEERINIFREVIFAVDMEERRKALNKLLPFQTTDFYKLLKIMHPYSVTIRLLDAPLHEFLPHTVQEKDRMIKHLTSENPKLKTGDITARIENLQEFNPMLGHRGCRIAISFPEIYEMQVKAIFEAAYMLKSEGIKVVPEIMIPIIMNINELKFIIRGKKIEGKTIKGIQHCEAEIKQKHSQIKDRIKYKIGTMIELPAAALNAHELARYAEFFSFGTNDLTQTTNGISRDDFNTFLPDYTEFDLLNNNPFQILGEEVKELIYMAAERGRLTRPDIKIGLCGEHGAIPQNIRYCKKIGLDYVSCSLYSIPVAKLAIAQQVLEEEAQE